MEKTNKVWSAFRKALLILVIGLATVLIVNLVRYINGEIDQFYIIAEGVNLAVVIFALGAGFVAWLSSNPDRKIFGVFVFGVGLFAAMLVGGIYDSWPVFYTFAVEGTVSALLVAAIPVTYP